MISFTPRAFFLVIAAACCQILSIWYFPRWVAAAAVGLAVALLALDILISKARIEIRREIPIRFELGKSAGVALFIINKSPFPLKITAEDCPPDIVKPEPRRFSGKVPAAGEFRNDYNIVPMRRGAFDFGETYIRYICRLGLVRKKIVISQPDTIRVFPNLDDFRKFQLFSRSSHFLMHGMKPARLLGRGMVFESLRDYQPDDDFSQIDWKATARLGKPISRNFEAEKNQNVILMLDTGRLMTAQVDGIAKLDYAIRTALALGAVCASNGDNTGLLSFDRAVTNYIPPAKGKQHFVRIMDALYKLAPSESDTDYASAFGHLLRTRPRRSLIVIFTDLIDVDASESLIKYLGALYPRHARLCVALKDSGVEDQAGVYPANETDFFRKSVAMTLQEKRALVFARLRGKGVGIVEARPENLSVELVEKYLELKYARFF